MSIDFAAVVGGFVHESAPMRVVFGAVSHDTVPAEVDRLGASRVLLVAGGPEAAYADLLADALGARLAGRFSDVVMHVPVEVARSAADAAATAGADLVVCLGGGSSTGAAKAIGLVVPALSGKLHGVALRVPVPDVSLVDLVVLLEKATTIQEVNDTLRAAAKKFAPGTLRVEDDLVVSSDLIGEATGSVFDPSMTHVQGGNLVKVVAWYDNEWGYTNRLYALANHILTAL